MSLLTRIGAARLAGWALSGIAIAFLTLDGTLKLLAVPPVVQATGEIGFSADLVQTLGVTLLVSTALYAAPGTAVLGAILITGFLGGAVSVHVRQHAPLFSHVLFGVYVGVLVWGGLYLRDPRLRALLPLRRRPAQAGASAMADSSRP